MAALTDPCWAANTIFVAEINGALVGIDMSGPASGEEWTRDLHVLYVLAKHDGTDVGTALLNSA
ncbi:GNAT superfamily N-acetyltransferase [Conyzicola lurida]|uniref:GNAT superfamily N-acetyltransferase n=1 Tax=Conyzicola lurida TaxID=1172621 RepID=A0A841ALU2_9MICO|nr:GNAT family N-acetyltransferase [Conyzicola lurida]MBB5843318.1 GNAT superfamily N-acetyltransferase [Conyzicola lurida]